MFRLLVAFLVLPFFCAAQDTLALFPDLSGEDLRLELVNRYKPFVVYDYSRARDTMYGAIYNVNDTVTCIYSGHKRYVQPGLDPSDALDPGNDNGINTEHVYPRSKGAAESNGNPFSDMHHLFPARSSVNSGRLNFPFGEIPDNQTVIWYRKNSEQGTIPTSNIDEYSELREGLFEPREDAKGNIARAMMYFYTMYKGFADASDANFFSNQIDDLCDWHYADPVDSLEFQRTYKIASYQNGRPNPFILDCTAASRIYCQNNGTTCENVFYTSTSEVKTIQPLLANVAPNPAVEGHTNLTVQLPRNGDFRYEVFSFNGQKINEQRYANLGAGAQTFTVQLPQNGLFLIRTWWQDGSEVRSGTLKVVR